MGKRIVVVLAGLALALGLLIWYLFFRGDRPFSRLEGAEIRSARLRLTPPDVTLELTGSERGELAELLRRVVTHRRDDGWRECAGQGVTFTLELRDGSERTVTELSPFLIVDGVGYRASHDPCQILNQFANRILAERG